MLSLSLVGSTPVAYLQSRPFESAALLQLTEDEGVVGVEDQRPEANVV